MSWLFIDAFLNSAKRNQLCTSMAEWAVLRANREVSFALSRSHDTKNAKLSQNIFWQRWSEIQYQTDKSEGVGGIKELIKHDARFSEEGEASGARV